MGRRPHFFKPYFASRSSIRLKIPADFRKHVAPYINARIFLSGRGGKVWGVHVEKDEFNGDIFLHRGWNRFVSDHALTSGDFLVFEHCGGPNFAAVIFDKSFCEAIQPDDREISRARVSTTGQTKSPKINHPPLQVPLTQAVDVGPRLGARIRAQREATEEEKKRALNSASSFRSKLPFAITVMQDSHVYHDYYLSLPRSLMKHLPRKSVAMSLEGTRGDAWKVTYVYYNGCGGLSSGWGLFAAAHNLERDDVVVFKLVGPLKIRVHIYRALE